MTAKELIIALQKLDPKKEVVIYNREWGDTDSIDKVFVNYESNIELR